EMKNKYNVTAEKYYYQQNYAKVIAIYEPLYLAEKSEKFYYLGDGQSAFHLAYAYQQTDQQDKASTLVTKLEQRLLKQKQRQVNNPDYYYQMAQVKSLQDKKSDALYFMQGAINVGWVRAWQAELEPVFDNIAKEDRFAQMMGGVKARLTTMRTSLEAVDEFSLDDNGETF
ncbi:MAG: hypothetical protein ACI8WB_002415, partial [Phenylobacterium sp.]